ncbi:MAG: cell wall-binding repeat-containing protein [Actinomycetota bacterium]|nr:cell wall-binding repeat-containing protein [Actinomycetota bacterium]
MGERRHVIVTPLRAAGIALALVGVLVFTSSPAHAVEPPDPSVFLARDDLAVDALAAGPVAAQFDAPVLVTPTSTLHPATAAALQDIGPDLVFLAGGTAALSDTVEQQIQDLGFATRRVAGANRNETAAALAALLTEFDFPPEQGAQGPEGPEGPAGPPGPPGASATTLFAVVEVDGSLVRGSGVVSSERLDPVVPDGDYAVVFDRDISGCAYQATVGRPGVNVGPTPGYAVVANWQDDPTNGVIVFTKGVDGAGADRGFHLTVTC